jgi:3-deoxy-D-manno-octulosonic-acid transferase
MRFLYSLALYLLLPLALLHLLVRSRMQSEYLRHIGERFALYPARDVIPVLWIHAVSVGETRAAEPLVKALQRRHPDRSILLTHMTPTGRETARALFGDEVESRYLPYDFPWAIRRFLRRYRPQAGIVMETELWPNLVHACATASVPLYLVNARLSERSAKRYGRFRSIVAPMLNSLNIIGAQTPRDAQRLQELGAAKVAITGNLKFDREAPAEQLALGSKLRERFGEKRRILLAASTREGEETLLLEKTESLQRSGALLVIVPRHPQRFEEVAAMLKSRGVRFARRSEETVVSDETQAVLGDSMGEMFAYYAACDVAFIGGSLLPLGGQNLLEACAVGKPVIVGPYTFNFEEATERAIAEGAALRVSGPDELVRVATELLASPERARAMGEAGRKFMEAHRGATLRTLELLGL